MIAARQTTAGASPPALDTPARRLRALAISGLRRMYRPEEHRFAFRLRRQDGRDVLEGLSTRYTAVALIGLAGEPDEVALEVLAGRQPADLCGHLVDDVYGFEDLGEVALTLWAARVLHHPRAGEALARLRAMDPVKGPHPTVELSWALTALTVGRADPADASLAGAIAQRLLASFREESALFPHWPAGARPAFLRPHVCCFADFVYPIHALCRYHVATGDRRAGDVASRCAARMCELQGPQGQWWWHFDVRTGRVVERYPVYAVHQDSMAPMALAALCEATGQQHQSAVTNGLRWLADRPEIPGPLIDEQAQVIWRKVGRHEPRRLVRGLQAAASRLHPALRVPGTDLLFPPGAIDFESRPYHMGWILHAWPGGQQGQTAGDRQPRGATRAPADVSI